MDVEETHDSEYEQEEEVSGVVRPSMSKETKGMMDRLCSIFPNKFVLVGQEETPAAQRVLSLNTSTPLFKINPILKGTWLDPPKQFDSYIGVWPGNIVFLKGTNPYVKDFVNKPPARSTETCIVNPNLKKLLTASKIKIANLNTTVFRVNDSTKLSGTSFVNVDYFMRMSLFDAFYTEELLSCALEFVPMLKAQL